MRRRLLRLVVCFTILTRLCAAATINVPADQTTIQHAIDAATNGDTVLVAPGTYFENIDFKGKAVTVTSTLSTDPADISAATAATIIDGGSAGPAVTFQTSEPRTAILEYFTIQNGGRFAVNQQFSAGGIYVTNSAPSILYNILNRNDCWSIDSDGSGPLIQGNTISATQNPVNPVGSCSLAGGAAIRVSGDLFGDLGPLQEGLPPTILGNVLENNVQSGYSGALGGAGIAVLGGSPIIEDNIIRNNASPGSSGGGINIVGGGDIVILQNLIYGNSAGCGGGGLAFQGNPGVSPFSVLVANNTIVNNTDSAVGYVADCIYIAQLFPDPDSYGLSSSTKVFVNNIISGSTSYPAINCDQISTDTEATQPIFDHNLLYNASGAFFGNFCVDTSDKYGNITQPPQFVNAAANDYRLVAGSPGIDVGNNSVLQSLQTMTGSPVTTDFQGNPRLQDATNLGYPIIDMGAYELAGKSDATPTTIVLTSSAYNGVPGPNYTLTATLASASGVPTGTVAFYLDDAKLLGTSAIVSGVATLANATLTPGVHSLYASYAATGSFTQATSVVIIVNIAPYGETLNLTSSPNPSLLGQNVTFTLKAASTDSSFIPSPVTLTNTANGNVLATLTPDSTGTATYSTSNLPLGSDEISATYAGDSTHASATTSTVQLVTSATATTTTLSSSSNPAAAGQAVTFTAIVAATSGTTTGTVTFTDGTNALGTVALANNIATYTINTLAVGVHPITATYNPAAGSNFDSSSASLNQLISTSLFPTSTIISNTPDQTNSGQSVTIRVAVTSTDPAFVPASVTLSESYNGDPIAVLTPNASGYASYTTTTLPGGYTFIYANYAGDATHAASSAYTEQYVSSTPVPTADLTSSVDPAGVGQPVTFTATITSTNGAPAGIETFQDDQGNLLGTQPIVDGVASITTSKVALGAHTITANYIPTGSTYTDLEAILVQVIDGTTASATTETLTSSLNPADAGQSVNLTATITTPGGTPTGSVTFTDGATTLATQTLTGGIATYTSNTLAAGTHHILATYTPDTNSYTASSATLNQVITGSLTTTTSLTVIPTSATYGTTVSMSSGVSSSGVPVTDLGTITFMDGATAISVGEPVADQPILSFNDSSLAVGTHTITAVYSGDATHNGSTSAPVTVTITSVAAALSLTAMPDQAVAFQNVTLSAKLTSTTNTALPISTITFLSNGTSLGTAQTNAQGVATFSKGFNAGTYTFTAAFAGAASLAAANSSAVTEVINPDSTGTSLSVTPNPAYQNSSVTLSATVTATSQFIGTSVAALTGSVAFYDAGTMIGSSPIDAAGKASFSATTLTVGNHALTAVYSGTANYLLSTSQPYSLNILASDFTVTADPSITIQTERHKPLAAALASVGDFTDTVSLSCANLPVYATCNFAGGSSNGSFLLAPGATLTTEIDFDTDALLNFAVNSRIRSRARFRGVVAVCLLLPLTLVSIRLRLRVAKSSVKLLLALFALAFGVAAMGCSGRQPGHTPPGTYNVTVVGRGVATGTTHTATITLIVTE